MPICTRVLVSFALAFGLLSNLPAQTAPARSAGPCPTANSTNQSITLSKDLVCTVPQVYGAGGLVGTPNNGPLASTVPFSHAAHFQNSSVAALGPLNSEIGTEISQLPIAAPAAGFVFTFNPSLGVVSRQVQNFGPILSDRAQTIGRHRLSLGVSYQYFDFDKIGAVNLRNFGAVFHHETGDAAGVCAAQPAFTGCASQPVFENDFITATNDIGLTVNQVTATADFGISKRFDVGVAIPVLSVHMRVSSYALVNSYESSSTTPPCCLHTFVSPAAVPGESVYGPDRASFLRQNAASGIGDVVFRAKYEVVAGERAALATGVDVHTPTGDAYNFLGAGTWGTRPFLIFSYAGRVAPHANIGYQINGNSILGGDITTFTKAHLPNILNYSFGFDAGLSSGVSVAFDYLGQTLFNERGAVATTYTAATPCSICSTPSVSTTPNITSISENIDQSSISLGGKVNPVGRLLVVANILVRVNHAGLHYKPSPMIGLSYSF